ncbi:MAG TPA: PLDc N-terminal domain-containing protein, partial [Chitinophagaceae bacterium]|nr:PLDc N-terminal domain-containing protein [Chitinophagaceae bacterium]
MKNISLILIALAGVVLFLAGAVPRYNHPVAGDILMAAGALMVFAFYLTTLLQVIRSRSIRNSRRIVWIILIICAPVVGNLIYILFHD